MRVTAWDKYKYCVVFGRNHYIVFLFAQVLTEFFQKVG